MGRHNGSGSFPLESGLQCVLAVQEVPLERLHSEHGTVKEESPLTTRTDRDVGPWLPVPASDGSPCGLVTLL